MLFKDDPRLTRYALGEMNDDERAAFERDLTDTDRAEAAAIRALAGTLAAELKADLSSGRTGIPACPTAAGEADSFKDGLRPTARGQIRMSVPLKARTRWILAAAASVAAVGLVGSMFLPSLKRAREVAVSRHGITAEFAVMSDIHPGQSASSAADARQLQYAYRDPQVELRSSAQPGRAREGLVAGGATANPNFWKTSQFDANDSFLPPVDDGVAEPAAADRFARSTTNEAPTADSYAKIRENPFIVPQGEAALSTFGIDVDTASYANVRRFLANNARPPADAVRIEELINYFPTSDAPPTDGRPFATYAEVARCPWNASHQLVRVALKAKEVAVDKRPPSNLVFLIDVSGSMNDPTKLPLVKRGLLKLVDALGENDRVAIVVYAGSSGLALPSTNAADKDAIRAAIDRLEAGGSTNGGQGIELAYGVAQSQFVKGGANRVVLCTDGDFNVGVVDRGALVELIQQKAKAGVFLSVLGFGRGNLKDDTMESLADKGNGNYAYIDSDREAQKVLVEQASGTLLTVAKDVKIQVEFNPAAVRSYRLIGYENRALAARDFNDDLKDAGEIGAGHSVVALYEIDPVVGRGGLSRHAEESLKYQRASAPTTVDADATELLTLKLRYKHPDAPLEQGTSELIEYALRNGDRAIDQASPDFQFAAAVAGFGMMLRDSPNRGDCTWPTVAKLAKAGVGADVGGHRAEFLTLVDRAAGLK